MTESRGTAYLGRIAEDRFTGIAVTRHGYAADAAYSHCRGAIRCLTKRAEGTERRWPWRKLQTRRSLLCFCPAALGQLDRAGSGHHVLTEKQQVTRALLRSGAAIGDMNALRKHLSQSRAPPRLARLSRQAGDAGDLPTCPATTLPSIGSGRPCPTRRRRNARAIVARFRLTCRFRAKALDIRGTRRRSRATRSLPSSNYRIVARPADALRRRQARATEAG